MLGYPGETIADIEETVDHLKRTGADLFLTTIAYPIKGTDFYREIGSPSGTDDEWRGSSDRNIRVPGRYSETFYWFANRYVVNEVRQHQLRNNGTRHWTDVAS